MIQDIKLPVRLDYLAPYCLTDDNDRIVIKEPVWCELSDDKEKLAQWRRDLEIICDALNEGLDCD